MAPPRAVRCCGVMLIGGRVYGPATKRSCRNSASRGGRKSAWRGPHRPRRGSSGDIFDARGEPHTPDGCTGSYCPTRARPREPARAAGLVLSRAADACRPGGRLVVAARGAGREPATRTNFAARVAPARWSVKA